MSLQISTEPVSTTGRVYSFVEEREHWRSVDRFGQTLPWYTRPCLEWLVQIIHPLAMVFEYGCGQSSNWYYSRTGQTYGVDNNPDWLPKNSCGHLLRSEKKDYIESIRFFGIEFDIIIIDGIYRDDCTEEALRFLKKGGYLICDNFEQASADLAHWPNTRELTNHLPVTLYKEPGHPDWCTAVFHNV